MDKAADPRELFIRARCSPRLRKRLDDYLSSLEIRGNTAKEAEIVHIALVEFLDRVAPVSCGESVFVTAAQEQLYRNARNAQVASTNAETVLPSPDDKPKSKHKPRKAQGPDQK